jgi:hypothetical protein
MLAGVHKNSHRPRRKLMQSGIVRTARAIERTRQVERWTVTGRSQPGRKLHAKIGEAIGAADRQADRQAGADPERQPAPPPSPATAPPLRRRGSQGDGHASHWQLICVPCSNGPGGSAGRARRQEYT